MSLKRTGSQTSANKGISVAMAGGGGGGGGLTLKSVYVTDSSYVALTPARSAVNTSGGYVSIIGTGFSANNTVYVQGIPATSVSYVSSTQINAQLPAYNTSSQSAQQIYVANPITNSAGILITGFLYSVMPYWTAATSQSVIGPIINVSLAALSDSALSYSISSGTLPTGVTLNTSTGVISGVTNTATSTTIVVYAVDQELQPNTQTFTITIIIGDQQFPYTTSMLNNETTVLPFNRDAGTSTFDVAVVGDSRPSSYNPYSNGYYSTNFASSSYITAPANSAYDITGGNFTVEFWVYFNSYNTMANSGMTLVGNFQNTNGWLAGFNGISGLVNASFNTYSAGAGSAALTAVGITSTNLPLYTWHHMAYVQSGANFYFFLDGVSYNATTAPTGVGAGGQLALGVYQQNLTYAGNPNVNISNLRIVKGTALYTANFTPPTAPLTVVSGTSTAFLSLQSSRNIDNSMHGATFTTSGLTPVQPNNPFGSTSTITVPTLYSVKFNGSSDYLTTTSPNFSSTGDLTLEGWAYITSGSTYQGIASMRDSGGINGGGIVVNNTGNLEFALAGVYYNSTACPLNQWFHVALVRSGSSTNNCSCYVNGNRVGQFTSTGQINGASNVLIIGRYYANGTNQYFTSGNISNLRYIVGTAIYSGATYTVPTSPLTATTGTVLLTCQSSTIIDNSSVNPVITSVGSAQPVTATPFTQVYAAPAVYTPNYYSVKFNGSTDYLTVPSTTAFAFGTGDFTVEMWMYPTATQPAFCGYFGTGANVGDFRLDQQTSGLTPTVNNNSTVYLTSSIALGLNQWNHLAVTRSGTTLQIFVNGVSGGSVTNSTSFTSGGNAAWIGKNPGSATYNVGYFSNVRIVKGTALYTAAFTPSTTPLTATTGTVLLTCQDAVFKDNSTSAFAITTGGAPSAVGLAPFVQTYTTTTSVMTNLGSTYFDSSGDYLSSPSSSNFSMGTGDFTIDFWMCSFDVSNSKQSGPFQLSGTAGGLQTTYPGGIAMIQGVNGVSSVNGGLTVYIGNTTFGSGGTAVIATSNWYHIAVTRQSGTARVFVNGLLVSSGASTENITGTYIAIGGYYSTSYLFNGYLADFRVVKGVSLYNANFAPPTAPLTAIPYTQLLTCQTNQAVNNSQFLDASSNNFLITRTGNVSNGTFNPFGVNFSNNFPSNSDYLTAATSNNALAFGTGDFTVECWFNLRSATEGGIVSGSASNSFGFRYGTANAVANGLGIYKAGIADCEYCSYTFALNTWYHVAVTRQSATIKFWINGQLQTTAGSGAASYNYGNETSTFIGKTDGSAGFPGIISNLRVVKGTALYTAAFTPNTTPLTATTSTSLMTCQGPAFQDNSGNAFAITVTGSPTVQKFSPFSNISQTPISYSTKFNGSSDYLTVPTNAALNFGSGDFTIEAWINPANLSADWFIISATGNGGLFFGNKTPGGFGYGRSAVAWDYNAGTITTNVWQHAALTRSGTSIRIFINGIQQGTTQTSSQAYDLGVTSTTIGSQGAALYFPGYISNLRVIKGTAVYTSNFTPPTSPLTAVANTSLLTLQDSTFKDNSTSTFAITAVSTAAPKKFNPFGFTNSTTQPYSPAVYGTSAYLNGSSYLSIASNSALSFGTNDFTIEFWMYPTAAFSTSRLLSTYTGGWVIYNNNAGNLLWDAYAVATKLTSTSVVPLYSWTHVAVTRISGTSYLYLNGVFNVSGADATNYSNTGLFVGADNGTNKYTGFVANLRIINGTAAYRSSFVPSLAPVTATTSTTFLLNNTPAIVDNTMLFNFETAGDAKLGTEQPYAGSYYSNYFNGSTDYLTAPSNTAFQFGTGAFTMEAWIYPTATASTVTQWIISNIDTASGTTQCGLSVIATTNKLQFQTWNSSILISTASIILNVWTHVAISFDGTTYKLFINGVLDTSGTTITNFSSAGTAKIGYALSGNSYFTGLISNARIVKGTAVYTANFTPSTAPLTAISGTSLLTCQSNKFIDNSTNNFTLTISGTPTVKTYNPFQRKSGQSMYFDGTGDYLATAASPIHDFGAGAFTIEMWIYPTLAATQQVIAFHGWSGSGAINYGWNAQINTSNQLAFYANGTLTAFTDLVLNFNSWNYITFVGTGGVLSAYKNGVKSTVTYTYTSIVDRPTMNLVIGGWNNNTENIAERLFYAGYIDDFRVTKGVARYTATFTPPTTALSTL